MHHMFTVNKLITRSQICTCKLFRQSFHRVTMNFVNEIQELNNSKVHIKNKENVNDIIQNIVEDGKTNLQVITDFDKTITKQHDNGKVLISSFGVFVRCPSITAEYLKAAKELTAKYQPIEYNPNVPYDEKKKLMEEWYNKLSHIIRGLSVSHDEIAETTVTRGPPLRDGTRQLLTDLNKAQVPVLIFSAGLGDAVQAILKHSNVLLPNVEIISNFLNYSDGIIQGFKNNPVIHVLNKNESALQGTQYYDVVKNRENVILMGDSIGDCEMADGVSHLKNILKIGFLYDQMTDNLPVFMDKFDIVLEDDQSMDVIRAILNYII